jgi:two-component system, sensor histidine kinase LadS
VLALFFICFAPIVGAAANPDTRVSLEYLFPVDADRQLNDVQSNTNWRESKDGWIKEDFSNINFWFGETPKIAWLKVDLSNMSASDASKYLIELASSGLSHADIYFQMDGEWTSLNSDELMRNHHQGLRHQGLIVSRFITFSVNEQWNLSAIYLRTVATHKFQLQVNLVSKEQHAIDAMITQAFFFFCYGILFVMAVYNLVIGRYLQNKLYYFYSLTISVTLLYQVFAHGHGRFFGYFNWDQVNQVLNFLAMSSAWTALIFLFYFVNLKQYAPKLAKYFQAVLIAFGFATLITFFLPANAGLNIALITAGPTPIFAMTAALWAWYRGSKSAAIFMFAWAFYILGGVLWVFYWMGAMSLNNSVEYPLVAGAALESILLSLALGYRIQLMQEKGASLKKSEKYYRKISALDPMTKLANRRAFDKHIKSLLREKIAFNLVLLDIDHFKTFNDSHGHLAGDLVIKSLAEILKAAIRSEDMAARVGGEEFALVIRHDNIITARNIAERMRIRFSETPFTFDEQTLYSSVSVGIAVVETSDTLESIVERADKALYRAKDKGRNQTQMSVSAVAS